MTLVFARQIGVRQVQKKDPALTRAPDLFC
jgi:hypothetical protein